MFVAIDVTLTQKSVVKHSNIDDPAAMINVPSLAENGARKRNCDMRAAEKAVGGNLA